MGRDIASQLTVGAQNSIVAGLIAVGIGFVLGLALGCMAAAARHQGHCWIEELNMRASDFTFAFPALLSAIMPTAIYGPGLVTSIVAIGIFTIPVLARITRGAGNAVSARDSINAARAADKGPLAITLDRVLLNIASQLIVQATIGFAIGIRAETALIYMGLSTRPPQPSWGGMLSKAQSLMFQAPLHAAYPGVAIVLSVLGLNLMGDGPPVLTDPKPARQR